MSKVHNVEIDSKHYGSKWVHSSVDCHQAIRLPSRCPFCQNYSCTMLNCPPLIVIHNAGDQMSWEVHWSTELKSLNNMLEADNGKHPLISTQYF